MKDVVALAGRVALIVVVCCALVSCRDEQKAATPPAASVPAPPAPSKRQQLLNTEVRALYITSWTAGISRFQTLTDMVSRSHLNAVVIDVKDSTGKVGYDSKVPLVAQTGAYEKRIRDLDAILRQCRDKKIYTIARIAVFQDPNLAKARPDLAVSGGGQKVWKDRKGLAWVDPASKTVWDYNLAIAKEVAAKGFDEIQFDYVRFPTDGKLKTMTYPVYKRDVPKYEIIRRFFQYVDEQMKPVDVMTSADIFGLTTMVDDDMNIGQRIQDVADHVDFVCPMIYPSHYPRGHLGLKNPAEHPYRVIYDACLRGMKRLEGKRAKMRPWLQDFKLGAVYDKKMVLDQIQAARDAKVFGFSMWNARNVYTDAAYLEKLPEPNPAPPLREQVLEDIRKHDTARLAMQNRSTSVKQEKPSIHKPRRKAKGN
ncbi:GTP-binding protein [Geobacter sp. FeAm09]|uniref:putative glycoside hydrolase n=1 Tax=Geobacter sp. FeAm09 TaxID=2597769 RepID=UPI0011ECA7B6|nr:putative glycoside hydrolase [Geobacter sp. FeAm09]QEM69203.1 GTP-binding protein [Geobacter sp. FeAm09]